MLTSPRVPAGLLSGEAWLLLRSGRVLAAGDPDPQADAIRAVGVPVHDLTTAERGDPAGHLLAVADQAAPTAVVWLTSPDGDPGLLDALAREAAGWLAAGRVVPSVEVVVGSFDPPGARLLDLVAVMDRLRSPGGCPWDAQQTHLSLGTYLLEETYEVLEALDLGDEEHLREELGDLLLQVVFHSRIAEERQDGWSVDDVAADIVAKLVRRHPHVFSSLQLSDEDELESMWERHKSIEKGRASAADGIPPELPALARAAKLLHRARRAGLDVSNDLATARAASAALEQQTEQDRLTVEHGARLLAVAEAAVTAGVDPEQALRRLTYHLAEAIRARERQLQAE